MNFLDLIWPKVCLNCQKLTPNDSYLCPECVSKIELLDKIWQGENKLDVLGKTYLDGYEVMARFSGPIEKLIKAMKYQGCKEVASLLGTWLWYWNKIPWEIDYICHVPLHRRRWLERGYNQAREMAVALSQTSGWPHLNVLERYQYNAINQAATASQLQRQTQLAGIFRVKKKFLELEEKGNNSKKVTSKTIDFECERFDLTHKNWLIIDDVLTTGSTLNECARALKISPLSANHVYGLVSAGH